MLSTKKFLQQADMTPVSHYEYQESIALALLDPENHGNLKTGYCTPPDDNSSLSTLTGGSGSTTSNGSKRRRVSDQSVDPISGSIQCRMENRLDHWPSTALNKRRKEPTLSATQVGVWP